LRGGGRGKKTEELEDWELGEICECCWGPSVVTGADPPPAMMARTRRLRRLSQRKNRRLCPVLLWPGE